MSNFNQVADFMVACDKEKTTANASAQVGELMWSFIELLETVSVSGPQSEADIATAVKLLRRTGGAIKRGQTLAIIQADKREDALRALCSIDMNSNGFAHLASMDKGGADAATIASLQAMLVDGRPKLNSAGKISAPDDWQPASMREFV